MKFKTLLVIFSVVAFVAGLACVLAPARMLSNYGISLIPIRYVVYQFWGSTLMGLGMLAWFAETLASHRCKKSWLYHS